MDSRRAISHDCCLPEAPAARGTVLFSVTPQLSVPPALTLRNAPSGGLAWPFVSKPQQCTARVSSAMPHEWYNPVESERNLPGSSRGRSQWHA